jgi:hypothetical protein
MQAGRVAPVEPPNPPPRRDASKVNLKPERWERRPGPEAVLCRWYPSEGCLVGRERPASTPAHESLTDCGSVPCRAKSADYRAGLV